MTEREVDAEMLDNLKMILEDRFDLLISTYISDSRDRSERLRDAVEKGDFEAIRHEAHGLKGSSRNIGANNFADICAVVEAQATQKDTTDLEQNVAAVEHKLAAVLAELNQVTH